ncbi:MAG TPA: FlgD immunoglobulin-like domain containing protein, partial [Bacteroidota bacterium]|nr:FlgD immunoglobulin-like domain containing protein [Bacteroidota bacterium]
ITAGQYIVNNLNEGDKFDVIDFDDIITPFRGALTPFTTAARDSAVQYIGSLWARGNTDIASAFSQAIPEFATAPDTTANIILFLTDGMATWGQTNTDSILAIVSRLVQQSGKRISIYNFGIGDDADKQLLTLLASAHGGFADFLGDGEVQTSIIDFYNTVRNPLMIAPTVQFAPDSVQELYPDPLPNLFKGQQILITGRYSTTTPVTVTFTGTAFGQPVSYQYLMPLADSALPNNGFLTKVWAKLKIEHLLVEYYAAAPGSAEAQQFKNAIIELSVQYGVQSPFTSFISGTSAVKERSGSHAGSIPVSYALIGNYPNPFNPGTNIRVHVSGAAHGIYVVKIFNIVGQLVRTLFIHASGPGDYQVYWDGTNERGTQVPTGTYVYTVDFGSTILAGKMLLVR